MVAELFKRGDLSADRHEISEDLHFFRATLDRRAPRARRLKSDEENRVLRVAQTQREMMQDPSASHHAA